ncbi:MAG: TIM barrel protein [Clostridiales bacterium]|nr:TIM barrel protein [Clostridiales bacterium]
MDQIAVMSVQYLQYTFDYYLDSMKKCNVRNIDLWGGTPHYCRLDYPTSMAATRKIREMRRKAEDLGMKIVIYTPETLGYPYSISAPSQNLRDRTIDYLEMAMDDALEMGTNLLFINTGCSPRDIPRQEGWERAVESIKILAEKAERRGVTLILEQLQPYESNLLFNISQMEDMLRAINSPALKICIDLVAMEVVGEKLEEYYERFSQDEIQFIHFADGDPSGHYILGDGNLPLKKYIKILEENNYAGIVDLEINDSIYWEDPHTSIKRSVDYLREFLPEHK